MKKLLPFLTVIIVILAACSSELDTGHTEEDHEEHLTTHNHISGDLQEETSSPDVLPSFLDDKSEDLHLVYEVAGKSTDILQWVPCYCGCGESAGHRSNLNCFVAETREDGSIVWDDHGTRCQVCVDTVVQTIQAVQDGKSIQEIRQMIDTQYGNGYAEPTPTEMPV
nr:PCYCGC motif-containing (lipo)protein [Lysinibacillus timonensis]